MNASDYFHTLRMRFFVPQTATIMYSPEISLEVTPEPLSISLQQQHGRRAKLDFDAYLAKVEK